MFAEKDAVEAIVGAKTEYLCVRWVGYSDEHDTWEDEKQINKEVPRLVDELRLCAPPERATARHDVGALVCAQCGRRLTQEAVLDALLQMNTDEMTCCGVAMTEPASATAVDRDDAELLTLVPRVCDEIERLRPS